MTLTTRTAAIGALALTALALASCSASAPDAAEQATPEPVETTAAAAPSAEPTETAEPAAELEEATPFGDPVDVDFGGSTWTVQLDAPRDVTAEIADYYASTGLDGAPAERNVFIGIPGTITRTGAAAAYPSSELSVQAIIDDTTVAPNGPTTDLAAIGDLDELAPGAFATFTEVFEVPAGTAIESAVLYVGIGEAGTVEYFGAPVDLGTPAVQTMKAIWGASAEADRATSIESWGVGGGEVTPEGIAQLVAQAEENGVPMDEADAEAFLTWVVETQQ